MESKGWKRVAAIISLIAALLGIIGFFTENGDKLFDSSKKNRPNTKGVLVE